MRCISLYRSLLLTFCVLVASLAVETGCATGNSTAFTGDSGTSSGRGADHFSAANLAAYVYVGNNVSGQEQGSVIEFPFGNSGVSLSAAGSSASGATGSLVVTSGFVFATDGLNIVTYTRDANGGVRQTSSVNGTAHNITPQGSSVGPLTVDRTGHTLYAAEFDYDGADDDAYSEWTINADGSLTFLANIGSNVDYNTYLSFTADNRFAYGFGCYFVSWDVFGLARQNDGTLTSFASGALPPPSNDFLCPLDVQTSAQGFAVVAWIDVEQQNSLAQLGSFTINQDGTLTLLPSTQIATPFTGEHTMAFDPTGTYLAVAGPLGLQTYKLGSGGTLTAIGSVVEGSVAFTALKWDNSNHLYAISSSGLYVFLSNAGTLTLAPGSPIPITEAGSLAVLPE
jgi:hypothetical protein